MSYVSPFTGDVIQPTDVSYAEYNISANLSLQWPSDANGTQSPAARIMEISASVGSLSVTMPPANQVSVGQDALIRNTGANTFTVKDYDGGTIIAIAAGEAEYIYVTDNSTTDGVWGIIAFGTGTSSADAATLAGLGLIAISTTLNQSHPSSTITNGYTFLASDRAQTKIWSSGAGSATLPDAATIGDNWFFLIKNNGSGTIQIACTGSDNIDGASTKDYAPNESSLIISTGTEFVTVGYGVSNLFSFTALVKPVTGGSYTLTSNEASNTIQEFVGVLTSNVTVYYPPVVNLYVASNQTTDNGYSLTLTTGVSGGSNATIPPGQQATLVCDGTNFFNANTVQAGATAISLINGTVGTPSLNFGSETSTGLYRPGSGQMGLAILGNQVVLFDTGGVTITGDIESTGTGNFKGGIAGGTFV